MVIRNYNECLWALECKRYNPENPCEKPSYKLLRKSVCYIAKEQGLVSKLPEKIMKGLMKIGEAITGGKLKD